MRSTGIVIQAPTNQLPKIGMYRDDVRELNSRMSPTARKILFNDDSREERVVLFVFVGVVADCRFDAVMYENWKRAQIDTYNVWRSRSES